MEYPLFFILILTSLSRMDLINVIFYIIFVVYCINPQIFTKHSIYLLIYADLIVFARYIYSLIQKTKEGDNWA